MKILYFTSAGIAIILMCLFWTNEHFNNKVHAKIDSIELLELKGEGDDYSNVCNIIDYGITSKQHDSIWRDSKRYKYALIRIGYKNYSLLNEYYDVTVAYSKIPRDHSIIMGSHPYDGNIASINVLRLDVSIR